LRPRRAPYNPRVTWPVTAAVLLGLLAILLAVAVVRDWFQTRAQRALGDPVLTVERGPYALGDVVRCGVSSSVHSKVRVERATLALVCLEDVEWTEIEDPIPYGVEDEGGRAVPTIRRTASEEVWVRSETFPFDRDLQAGEALDCHAEFQLPHDGPPSFRAPHNRITWSVQFVASVPGLSDAVTGATIQVAPLRRRAPAGM
jgi:hypothetical protein